MANQKLTLGITGLSTNNNNLLLPDGAIISASNVNVDRKLAEGRRGFSQLVAEADVGAFTEYQDKLLAWKTDNTLAYYSSGFNAYSTSVTPVTDKTIKFLQASQNLYMTTNSGVKVLDAYNSEPISTGMPKGLEGAGAITGSSGFMANDTQVAYRVLWGTRDANDNLYLGTPGQRIIVSNSSGGTRDVALTFTIPSGISTSDFFQIYRSRTSASATTEPDDELSLVYEANPTSGEITAKEISYTDATDDSLKGAYLYTNANQEGIQESNDEPPLAADIAQFKGFTFFGNVKTKHSTQVNLLAVGGSGLVANDTITINGMVFTAKASTTVANREFAVVTSGSAAQNVDDTARQLVKVVNQYASNTTIYAYYVTGYADLPGQIVFEERALSSTAFTVSVSRAAAWDVNNSGTSQNNNYQAGLMWSKLQQPEHVPAGHLEQVGSKSFAILRIIALKDALFILKEDGVFRLTGANGSWTIEALDSSTSLLAPDSAVVINNQIYCLANQGVVSIADTGVSVIGEDIKDSIQELIGLDYDALQTVTFGVGYETDRKYILSTITNAGETTCSQQFVYNVFTSKWSRWTKTASCGIVTKFDDKLYFSDLVKVSQERKSFTYRDHVDEELAGYEVISSSNTVVTLNLVTGLTVGDLLYESSSVFSPILSIDNAASTVTVADVKSWTPGAITVLQGIDCRLEWAPLYCENSGHEKVFEQLICMFKQNRFRGATLDFFTDTNGGWESVSISGAYGTSAWGGFAWGAIPWGGSSRPKPTRVSVPRNKSRGQLLGVRFSCRMAYSQFTLEGLSLTFDMVSERQGGRS